MINTRHSYAKAAFTTLVVLLAACAERGAAPKSTHAAANYHDISPLLFWPQAERDANFSRMEQLTTYHVVKAGGTVRALPDGKPLPLESAAIDSFMQAYSTVGLLVLQDGRVRLERYRGGLTRHGRWMCFSVTKSITSTLVGAAIHDGYIQSVDEPATKYLPDLAGSAYDGVTIDQLLTMRSGVKWSEELTDPNSEALRMYAQPVKPGKDATVEFMKTLTREAAPGTQFVYKSGEAHLIGSLVRSAAHESLADYLSERVWIPYGMEQDAFWLLDPSGHEQAGCCLLASLRDYGRLGQFVLEGGHGAVGPEWFSAATAPHVSVPVTAGDGRGYGYQWWTFPGGVFSARGIYGQTINIDPARKLIVVILSSWPKPTYPEFRTAQMDFLDRISHAADR